MALIKADRVKETTTSTGSGTGTGPGAFTLDGAVAGYRAFSAVMATGDICYYTAINPTTNEWECGWGTFTSPNTLERTRKISGSNEFYANFSSGTKEVFISVTANQIEVGEYPSLTSLQIPSVYLTSAKFFSGSNQPLVNRLFATVANVIVGLSPMKLAAQTAGASLNVAIGSNSLSNIGSSSTVTINSSSNVAIGSVSGFNLFSGIGNICIGREALGNTGTSTEYNLNHCILFGTSTYTLGTSDTNSIVIGANAIGNGSNTTTIGHTTITDCYLRGHLHPSGAVRPASIDDASAPTNAIYYSTTAGKLVYKDSSGVVNNLY